MKIEARFGCFWSEYKNEDVHAYEDGNFKNVTTILGTFPQKKTMKGNYFITLPISVLLGITLCTISLEQSHHNYVVAFSMSDATKTTMTTTSTVSSTTAAKAVASSVSSIISQASRGGGRAAGTPNKIDRIKVDPDSVEENCDDDAPWEVQPVAANEARLIVLQITDVYTLENFASFQTLLKETKEKAKGAKVICVLTGDFLSPYLLSSIDRGSGMMRALCAVPFDYLTWGNHEADIEHRTVCRHVKKFCDNGGKWINSNMLDHATMQYQQEYDVIEISAPDGSQRRKVGLCAVLSDDKALYSHFKAPGAFGGATITDPWEALAKYKQILESEQQCDFVLPMEHLYVPDDHITCQKFDFPVVLSGHDHQ